MEYIVIEKFNDIIHIVTKNNGNIKVFNTLKNAEKEALNCQNGIVIPLIDSISLLKDIYSYIDYTKLKLGEDIDPNNIESKITKILI